MGANIATPEPPAAMGPCVQKPWLRGCLSYHDACNDLDKVQYLVDEEAHLFTSSSGIASDHRLNLLLTRHRPLKSVQCDGAVHD